MTAAVKVAAFVAGMAPQVQTTGTAMKEASYTVTIVTEDDWSVFSDFETVTNVRAETVADGVSNPCTIDGTTTNKVVYTGATTGATRVIVWGY